MSAEDDDRDRDCAGQVYPVSDPAFVKALEDWLPVGAVDGDFFGIDRSKYTPRPDTGPLPESECMTCVSCGKSHAEVRDDEVLRVVAFLATRVNAHGMAGDEVPGWLAKLLASGAHRGAP